MMRSIVPPIAAGAAVGVALASLAIHALDGMLISSERLGPLDEFALVALVVTCIAVATYIPARRAARVDPLVALSTNNMDIARPLASRRRILPRIVAALIGAAIVGVGAWGVRSLRTGYAPTFAVDRAAVISDVAHRGDLIRSVPASGTLAARRVAVIAAPGDGVIAAVFVRPGSRVRAGTAIVQLSNPLTESKIADARAQIASARAELASVRQQAVTARLEHEQALRATQAESASDRAQVSANRSLHEQGLIADLPYRQAVIKLAGEHDRERLQQAEIVSIRADGEAKIAAAQAHVVQLQGLLARDIAERDALPTLAWICGFTRREERLLRRTFLQTGSLRGPSSHERVRRHRIPWLLGRSEFARYFY